jgi:DNA-binding IclR family transcriptional regulator
VAASLTIAGPLYRLDGGSLDEHVSSVKQAATAISRKIGNG